MSSFFWGGAIAAMILLSATPGRVAEPVTRIDVYVTPYFAAAEKPDGKPTVAVGETFFNALLASNRREDIVAARDLVEQQPDNVTPMTMMVLAIRLYDVALRDDAVFWFYAAKGRYITLASVIDVGAAGLAEVDAAMGGAPSSSPVRSSTAMPFATSPGSRRRLPPRSTGSRRIPTRSSHGPAPGPTGRQESQPRRSSR